MKLAIVQTKGGTGKTTSALYLALAAVKLGKSVEVLDADSQGSASDWAIDAEESGTPLPFAVNPANAVTFRKKSTTDFTIIDTPPGDSELVQAAIDAADVVIIPTNAAPMDIRRAWATLSGSRHRPTAVLVANAELASRLLRDTREVLAEENVFVFPTTIPKRLEIRAAFGTCPTHLHGYDDVLNELLEALQ